MFGMGAPRQLPAHYVPGRRANGQGPIQEPSRGPFPVLLVGFGQVFRDGAVTPLQSLAGMAGHPLLLVEDFYRPGTDPQVNPHTDQTIGYRVKMPLIGHMGVDTHLGAFPERIHIVLCGQGL